MEAKQAGNRASSKELITVYPVNDKSPKPKKSGEYIGKDIAIGRPVPAGRYSPGMDILPPAPYPGPEKARPSRYIPEKQGKEFDLSQLRKYLEEIMEDTVYIMIPVRKKDLAKYRN